MVTTRLVKIFIQGRTAKIRVADSFLDYKVVKCGFLPSIADIEAELAGDLFK